MSRQSISARSLTERIEILSQRKSHLEDQIAREIEEGAADDARISDLKTETTGLRNAIRVTRTVLSQTRARMVQPG